MVLCEKEHEEKKRIKKALFFSLTFSRNSNTLTYHHQQHRNITRDAQNVGKFVWKSQICMYIELNEGRGGFEWERRE